MEFKDKAFMIVKGSPFDAKASFFGLANECLTGCYEQTPTFKNFELKAPNPSKPDDIKRLDVF